MRKVIFTLFSFIYVCTSCSRDNTGHSLDVIPVLDHSLSQYMQLYEVMQEQPGRLPRTFTAEGKLETSTDKWWTSGFYPGSLWYLYEYSDSTPVRVAAEKMTALLEKQQYTTDNHDVGFIISCSYGNGYRLTGNESYKDILITAARSLSTRYSPVTGCIRSWNRDTWQYPVIIDNMMNLELLCEATRLSGDSTFLKIAVSHADTTMKYHFRPDGSSYHVVNYDTVRGGAIEQITYQGAFDESAWARGQGWGLYGYTMMYRKTGNPVYLQHAIKIAEFIVHHPNLPEDKVPYWDFDAPGIPDELRDASAGAVIASGLLELSRYVAGKDKASAYVKVAEDILRSLSSGHYMAEAGSNGNFILKRSVGFMAKNSEVNVPLTYADYYFIEALLRYRSLKDNNTL